MDSIDEDLSKNETPENPSDDLTIDESAAIRLYTVEWEQPHRSLYSLLNQTLKGGNREELRPYSKYLKLLLTALVKIPCVPPLTIWRGVTRNLSAKFPPGTEVTWWSFSSCTTSLTVLENNMYLGTTGVRTLFSVEAINGRKVRDHSHFVTEDEILLLPGTHMIVQSQLSPAPDLHFIHLKQVIPKQTLLEPPFEGAHLYPELKYPWYKKKQFFIPLSLLIILSIGAIIIGSVLGSRKNDNIPIYQCMDPYSSPATSGTGKLPVAIVFGNFQRVNQIDLAVLNYDEQSVDILSGNGKHDYETEYRYMTDSAPSSVFNVDLNKDGLPDLIVTNGNDDTISVLVDNPDKTFQISIQYPVGDDPISTTAGYFNNDTQIDVLVANSGDNTVNLLLGDEENTFSDIRIIFDVGSKPVFVISNDFNKDGKLDWAVINQ
ncbi:unnamed protein product, partial [Rotaria sordida]